MFKNNTISTKEWCTTRGLSWLHLYIPATMLPARLLLSFIFSFVFFPKYSCFFVTSLNCFFYRCNFLNTKKAANLFSALIYEAFYEFEGVGHTIGGITTSLFCMFDWILYVPPTIFQL